MERQKSEMIFLQLAEADNLALQQHLIAMSTQQQAALKGLARAKIEMQKLKTDADNKGKKKIRVCATVYVCTCVVKL
jgi:hypothetical protein